MTQDRDNLLPEGVTIERATLADADAFVAIHEETARWLWSRGIRQWEPGTFRREWIIEPIERGEVYLARHDGEPIGAVMLQWSDETTWGKRPADAGYIHGLRMRRAFAGQGLGRAMLRWAEREIVHSGMPYARLDCFADNATLRAYYEQAGYQHRGDVAIHGYLLARYEKWLADVVATPYGKLAIGRATLDDVAAIATLWEEGNAWMRARGITPGEPPRPRREIIAGRVERGEAWVARRGAEVVGTLTLMWDDDLWDDLPGDALYVHGLASRRALAGQGIGAVMLRWAEGVAAAAGKTFLRLDCDADNPALRAYYERVGFTHRGDIALAHRVAARYERRVA